MLDSTTIQERRRGIGGSDAAKILGVSSWGGAFSVWQDKVNDVRPELKSDEAVHWGNVLEEVVAREFSEREHLQLRKRETVFSKEYPFMLANVDREIIGVNAGLECKTANAFKSGEWDGDNLPDDYYVQIQHYCSVMNWDGCWIACLIGGQKFVSKLVPRNNAFIKDMIEIERDFWENYVMTKTPPALSIADKIVVQQKTEDLLTPTPEDLEYAKRLSKVNAEIKNLETYKKVLETELKSRIGENAGIEGVATYKKIKDSVKVDWDALSKDEKFPQELIEKYSHTVEGYRRFLLKYKEVVVENGDN